MPEDQHFDSVHSSDISDDQHFDPVYSRELTTIPKDQYNMASGKDSEQNMRTSIFTRDDIVVN